MYEIKRRGQVSDLSVGMRRELVSPPPSLPAAAAEAALHRSQGGAAARAASSVEASYGELSWLHF
jgi:hypothetical protein